MSELNILSGMEFDKFLCSPSNGRIRIRFFKLCQNLAERFPFAHNNNVAGNPYKSLCLQETFEKSFIKKSGYAYILYMPQETFEKSFIKKSGYAYILYMPQEKTESRWRTNKCFAKAFFSCGKKSLGKKCFAKTIGGK